MVERRTDVRLDLGAGPRPAAAPTPAARSDQPFRILVIGDFSGRESRGVCEPHDLATRRCHPIDRDEFEDVMAALAPELHVRLGPSRELVTSLSFCELDDFHPDELHRRAEVFDRLREVRARLANPATAAAAIAELTTTAPAAAPPPPAEPAATEPAAGATDLLDAALAATESGAGETAAGSGLVDRLVRELVVPHVIPRPDPRQVDLLGDVDRATGEQMRALLRAPEFRALESAWRGLHLLVHRLDTSRRLQIHVLDVSRPELEAALTGGADPLRSGLAVHVVDRPVDTPGGEPFAVVVGAYAFGPAPADIALLEALGVVAARAGAPLLAAAAPSLSGFAPDADPGDWQLPGGDQAAAWQRLRERPEAAYLGLAAPRFLLRLPYGRRTSPTACFDFDEEGTDPSHDDLLWGNPAFLVALVLAQAWQQSGWQLRPGEVDRVGDLPVHIRTVAGSAEAVPCAEAELTTRGGGAIADRGLMPLYSVRGTDTVQLGTVRSLAIAGPELAGRWR